MIRRGEGIGGNKLWLGRGEPEVRGRLQQNLNRFDDSSTTIYTEKQHPHTERRKTPVNPLPSEEEAPEPEPECIPPDPDGIIVGDPAPDPAYTVGQEIEFTETLSSGITEPIFWQWFLNGAATVTTETYTITITDGMITNKDETGLGIITIGVTVSNPCGQETKIVTFPAQGDPP